MQNEVVFFQCYLWHSDLRLVLVLSALFLRFPRLMLGEVRSFYESELQYQLVIHSSQESKLGWAYLSLWLWLSHDQLS